jgi:hypothetical protein
MTDDQYRKWQQSAALWRARASGTIDPDKRDSFEKIAMAYDSLAERSKRVISNPVLMASSLT